MRLSAAVGFSLLHAVFASAATITVNITTCAASSMTAQGANLDADGSCPNFSLHGGAGLQIITSGGATFAFPRWGSPVIDAATDCTDGFGASIISDVRGTHRPQGAACDIGAVEADYVFVDAFGE